MTSLANNGHKVRYDINFLQDPQLRDSPRVADDHHLTVAAVYSSHTPTILGSFF